MALIWHNARDSICSFQVPWEDFNIRSNLLTLPCHPPEPQILCITSTLRSSMQRQHSVFKESLQLHILGHRFSFQSLRRNFAERTHPTSPGPSPRQIQSTSTTQPQSSKLCPTPS